MKNLRRSGNKKKNIYYDPIIAISAFRYALGRRTYVVQHTADWLIEIVESISPTHRGLISREIELAIKDNNAGMDMDIKEWRRVALSMDFGTIILDQLVCPICERGNTIAKNVQGKNYCVLCNATE